MENITSRQKEKEGRDDEKAVYPDHPSGHFACRMLPRECRLDLHYDGEHIVITSNKDNSERWYDKIVVSKRYAEHYKGEFAEYWAVSDPENGPRELLLQIHPDLANMTK